MKIGNRGLVKQIFNGDQFDRPGSNLLSVSVKGRNVYLCVRGFSEKELSQTYWHYYIKKMIATDDTYGDIRVTMIRRMGR